MNQPASLPGAHTPPPTQAQQRVLERIAAQRERLRARRRQRLQAEAQAESQDTMPVDAPLVQRLVWFTREHPVAVAAVAGAALMAGPGRLVRWAGVLLPLVLKLRGR